MAALDGTVYLVDTNLRKIRWSFSSGPPIYSSYQASLNNDDDRHNNNNNASELSNDLYYVDCGDDWELYVHSKRFGKLVCKPLSFVFLFLCFSLNCIPFWKPKGSFRL